MSIFGASRQGNGSDSQSDRTAKNMTRAAKSARRGGTAIRQPKPAKPRQV